MKSMTDNSVECIEEKHPKLLPQLQQITPQAQEEINLSQTEEPQGSSMVSHLIESWRNTQSFIEKRTGQMEYPKLESAISLFIEWLAQLVAMLN